MNEFVITLLLGWLGVHKFMQKKYVLGVLYLCTLGLCGIGWAVDTIAAFTKMLSGRQQERNENRTITPAGKQLIKSFDTVIVDTFTKCDMDKEEKREDVIMRIRPKYELDLKLWFYKKEPAYYVCYGGLDAGNIRAGLAKILYEEYRECEFKVIALDRGYDDRNDCLTQNIRIEIYADKENIGTNWAEITQEQAKKDGKTAITSFDTIIVGTFAECSLDTNVDREDIIDQIKPKDKLSLRQWTFEGEPAYYVVYSNGLDAGCIPAMLAKFLYKNYENCEFEVTAIKADLDEHGNDTFEIRIDVYK